MLALLLYFLLAVQGSPVGIIEVSVMTAETMKPLAGAEVTISGQQSALAMTDSNGRAVFPNLAPGVYRLQVTHDGYFTKQTNIGLPAQLPPPPTTTPSLTLTTVLLGANQPSKVSILMEAGGSISGRLRDTDRSALSNAVVTLGAMAHQNGRRILVQWYRTTTDSDGNYGFRWVIPGAYYVRAEPKGSVSSSLTATYYPGNADAERATWITVRGGEEIVGIDFDLGTPLTFTISGKVLNAPPSTLTDGRMVRSVPSFTLVPRNSNGIDAPGPVLLTNNFPSPDGEFSIKGVPPGAWDLIPVIRYGVLRDQVYTITRTPVDVVDRHVDNVTVSLNSHTVKGRVILQGGEPLPIAQMAMLVPRDNTPLMFLGHVTSPKTISFLDGTFAFGPLSPGKYSFRFEQMPPGFYLSDLRLGGRSILDEGMVEVGTTPVEPLEVVLGRGGARVEGKVRGMEPNAGGQVRLVPKYRKNLLLYHSARLSADGSFSFSYVAPGDYKVFAWRNLPAQAEQSSEFLSRYEDYGTAITVVEGGPNSVLLTLISEVNP